MRDVVLDTHSFGEFLAQYFDNQVADRGQGKFLINGHLRASCVQSLNRIIKEADLGLADLVIVSPVAIIELLNQWEKAVAGRFRYSQFEGFIRQPPDWFSISSVDFDLVPFYLQVPATVVIGSDTVPIELMDALHVAACFSRGENCVLSSSDTSIRAIANLRVV
jgi:hypothetical protein